MRDQLLTQADVESDILRLCRALEVNTHELATFAQDAAQADSAFKKAHATAYLMTSGTVAEREAFTHIEVADEYDRKCLADQMLRLGESKGRNIRASLDALRSVNSNLRQLVSN